MRYRAMDMQLKKELILHKCITLFSIGDERMIQIIKDGRRRTIMVKILERLPDIEE